MKTNSTKKSILLTALLATGLTMAQGTANADNFDSILARKRTSPTESALVADSLEERNKKLTREAYEAIARRDLDKFITYIADNAIDYGIGPTPVQGKAAIIAGLKDFFSAFPDYTVIVSGIAADGNKVYVQNTFKGTQKGAIGMIPATGKPVIWNDVDILEFDQSGKISAHWANNPNAVLDQIGFHSFSNPNTAVVMNGYALFGKGDIAGILAACADDVVWDTSESPSAAVARVYKGKTELAAFFKALATNVQITKFQPYRFLADGDDVVTFINTEYKLKGSPKPFKVTVIHHFVVRDGKIVFSKEIMDKPQAVTVAVK
ncbi:SnoaL-like domain-containing protein [Spirosoma taeanense]|uniref:SnoaL-like domain-containing protein n=1 Tax=Spirosoma taeanense TaxID=2735870 RepID=A0A6M5YAI7_9BACT|nr:nuclear transport factor 2 family protein [Spirosoma taeanense]QJW90544.1 SnoaL-like domain-containing protein [Spirosoma taeanense]